MTHSITTAPARGQHPTDALTPWTLGYDRDGTEDVAVIRDAAGDAVATSRPFRRPEADDPDSPTLAAMRLMHAAPALLDALTSLLAATACHARHSHEYKVAAAVAAEATDTSVGRAS